MTYSSDNLAELPASDGTSAAAPARVSPMVWLLIGYMWLFLHRPFEIWTWMATIHVERMYMIVTIVCWFLYRPRFPARNRLQRYLGLFTVVMLTSWWLSPYQAVGDETIENWLKYAVFYGLLVTSIRTEQDVGALVAGYVAVVTLVMAHSLREYFCGRSTYAQGIVRLSCVGNTFDANDFAGLIVCCLPFSWVLWRQWTAWWKRVLLLGHFGLAGCCVMLTGSRMGFIGVILASMLACLASPRRWRLLAIYPVVMAVAWMLLPENRQKRYLTLIDSSYGPASATSSAGNYRLSGFNKALPMFEERSVLGFGPMSFRAVKGIMPHNLYGQLLAELGTAGAIAFGLLLWGVARNTWEARRIVRAVEEWQGGGSVCPSWGESPGMRALYLAWQTVAAAAAAVLLLAIMGWGFNFLFWHVWLWFGGFQIVALQCLKRQSESLQCEEPIGYGAQDDIVGAQCD